MTRNEDKAQGLVVASCAWVRPDQPRPGPWAQAWARVQTSPWALGVQQKRLFAKFMGMAWPGVENIRIPGQSVSNKKQGTVFLCCQESPKSYLMKGIH